MRACRSFNLSCNILSETARLSRSLEAFARRSGGQPLTHHQWILPRSLHLSPRAGFAGFSESSVFVQILLESQVRVFACLLGCFWRLRGLIWCHVQVLMCTPICAHLVERFGSTSKSQKPNANRQICNNPKPWILTSRYTEYTVGFFSHYCV